MEFRRITGLPPYVLSIIDQLKLEARRAGTDVIDLGFGNPDIPSPDIAVEKLAEAAHNPRNHRYSSSPGIPKLRQAIANLYLRRFGVELDPDTECINTIGAKEGLSHLMWVLLGPGDSVLVPSPSYPIHIYAPLFAGAEVQQVLDGRVARGLHGRQRGSGRRAAEAEVVPRLRHVPAHSDRGHCHPERGPRLPEGRQRDLPGPARRAV